MFDTWVEDVTENYYPDRPWDKGNNPKTAVWDFIKTNTDFIIDKSIIIPIVCGNNFSLNLNF